MTNYNKRLDEIFAPLIDSPSLTLTTAYWDEAKQALTSLIKELVAEAKPNKKPQFFCQGCDKSEERGYNEAIKEFEQNLLKALEDK
ncbi:MAG: hypothetical protein KDJ52_32005 [Anaerolineae bacterium]|nr:hypothetical protein [Anaerolineae bacterium]